MGTIKTSELIGVALDWAVAKCEGFKECLVFGRGTVRDKGFYKEGSRDPMLLRTTHSKWVKECEGYPWHTNQKIWEPSTNWSQGGPIIEREKIELLPMFNPEYWSARVAKKSHWYEGPTPMIAAMRCYVASKLGDEIDIPEELA